MGRSPVLCTEVYDFDLNPVVPSEQEQPLTAITAYLHLQHIGLLRE